MGGCTAYKSKKTVHPLVACLFVCFSTQCSSPHLRAGRLRLKLVQLLRIVRSGTENCRVNF